jgi:hypothetical protein
MREERWLFDAAENKRSRAEFQQLLHYMASDEAGAAQH